MSQYSCHLPGVSKLWQCYNHCYPQILWQTCSNSISSVRICATQPKLAWIGAESKRGWNHTRRQQRTYISSANQLKSRDPSIKPQTGGSRGWSSSWRTERGGLGSRFLSPEGTKVPTPIIRRRVFRLLFPLSTLSHSQWSLKVMKRLRELCGEQGVFRPHT